ncbi:MAG: hypothetical protein NTZ95_03340, partial [Candidatus Omnitrophica bacterium]|nr:hypothetical protein [Candidatus Omnitrophota bacterium]
MKNKMKKLALTALTAAIFLVVFEERAYPTASTHIWAPSTDTQDYGTGHITADVYIPVNKNADGSEANTITNTGLTFGILPFTKFRAEVGLDYKTGYGDLDSYPIYFNAKVAIPEDAYSPYFPGIAVGLYDIGTQPNQTNFNIIYGKAAKTIKVKDLSLGRFSMGYFWGNRDLLLDGDGNKDNRGVLAAWERTMTEISDKLWICVEYQGTRSGYGSTNLGCSWQLTKSTSILAGYEFYNNLNFADTI